METRLKIGRVYGLLCLLAASQGLIVVCSAISLARSEQEWNRANLPGFFEVLLDMPPEVIKARDYKRVYGRPGGLTAPLPRSKSSPKNFLNFFAKLASGAGERGKWGRPSSA